MPTLTDKTLSAILEEGIAHHQAEEAPSRNQRWRASEVGKCERAQLFAAWGVPPDDISPEIQLKFLSGHMHEQMLLDLLTWGLPEGYNLVPQYPVEAKELNLAGHVDMVIADNNGDILSGIECKALNYFFWRKIAKEGLSNTYFYGQLQAYAYMLNIDNMILAAIERNTPAIHFYNVPREDQYIARVKAHIETIDFYYEEQIIPDYDVIMGDKACDYCFYNHICRSGNASIPEIRGRIRDYVDKAQRQGAEDFSEEDMGAGQ